MSPLVLGSSSPWRKELLQRLHLDFTTDSPQVDETPLPGEVPAMLAARLSQLKARAVKEKFPNAVVIGSDQVLDLEGQCLGKPGNFERARQQLHQMSGRTLVFQTAVTVIDVAGAEQHCLVPTEMRMRHLTDETIQAYLRLEEPYNCAGSAKIEKMGIALVEEFKSPDPTAIIGLPLMRLTEMLSKAGVSVLPGL